MKSAFNTLVDVSQLILVIRLRTGLTQKKFAVKRGVTLYIVNNWKSGCAEP